MPFDLSLLVSACSSFLICTVTHTDLLLLFVFCGEMHNLSYSLEEQFIRGRYHLSHLYNPYGYPSNLPRLLSFLGHPFQWSNFRRLRNLVPLIFRSNCAFEFKKCSWCFLNIKMKEKKKILFSPGCWNYHRGNMTLWMQPYRLGFSFPKCLYTLTAFQGLPPVRRY